VVQAAADRREPAAVVRYVFEVLECLGVAARERDLVPGSQAVRARAAAVRAARVGIENGLMLLGVSDAEGRV
jgi:hypothetical protein